MRWIPVARIQDIPLREGRAVQALGHKIALFNLGDRFVAVEDRCPHRGGPLSDGIVAGGAVVCPLHSWKVCLASGAVKKPQAEACVETYPTRIENGIVLTRLNVAAEGPQHDNSLCAASLPQYPGPHEIPLDNVSA